MVKDGKISVRIEKSTEERIDNVIRCSNGRVTKEMIIINGLVYYEGIYNSKNVQLIQQTEKVESLEEELRIAKQLLNQTKEEIERDKSKSYINVEDPITIESFENIEEVYNDFLTKFNVEDGTEYSISLFDERRYDTIRKIKRDYELEDLDVRIYLKHFLDWYKEKHDID